MKEILSKPAHSSSTKMNSTPKLFLSLSAYRETAMIGLPKDRSVQLKSESTGVILLPAPNLLKEMPGKLSTLKLLKN